MTITIAKKSGIKRIAAAVLAAATLISVAACGSGNSTSVSDSLNTTKGKTTTVTVGVCAGPYGDMVKKVIAPLLKEDGFELKTKLFNDYVQPNKALASGSIQANLFQHGNYLKKFTADNNLDLTSLGQTPTLGLAFTPRNTSPLRASRTVPPCPSRTMLEPGTFSRRASAAGLGEAQGRGRCHQGHGR